MSIAEKKKGCLHTNNLTTSQPLDLQADIRYHSRLFLSDDDASAVMPDQLHPDISRDQVQY
jgi:hypothetical protein